MEINWEGGIILLISALVVYVVIRKISGKSVVPDAAKRLIGGGGSGSRMHKK